MIRHAAAVAFFAALACAFSYPLILNLSTHVPGPPGDNFAFVWNFWWFRLALASGASFFECPYLFAPFGVSLVLDSHMALQSLTGATLLAPLPIVAAHNVTLLAGLAANGIAAYALAYAHVRRVMPAVLAGVIFSTSAYVGLHFLGHFNLVHVWVLPVAALAWIRFVERPGLVSAVRAAAAFAVMLYSDYYYFVYAVVFAVLWVIATEWRASIQFGAARNRAAERAILVLAALVALASAIIVFSGGGEFRIGGSTISARSVRNPVTALWILFLSWAALRSRMVVRRRADSTFSAIVRNLGWTIAAGAVLAMPLLVAAGAMISAGDYVAPVHQWRSDPPGIDALGLVAGNPMHAVYGRAVIRLFDRLDLGIIDQSAWIGLAPLVVAACVARMRPRLELEYRRWLVIGLCFLVWAAGPFLQIGGSATGVVLPQFFTRFVPLLSNARIPGRGFVMVMLAAAILCALAVTEMRWRSRTIAALIALAFLDGLVAPFPLSPVPRGGRIEEYLAGDPRPGSVLVIPTGYQDGFGEAGRFDASTLAYQMRHHRPIVGGYISRVPDRIKRAYRDRPAIAALIALSSRNAPPESAALPDDLAHALADDGVAFVVMERVGIPTLPSRQDLELRGLTPILNDGIRELYAVGRR
ncbi:MAG TPA: hypothetical protein VH740_11135 [Vicinamibacterales bacterium]